MKEPNIKKRKPKMNNQPRTDKPIICHFGFSPQLPPEIPIEIPIIQPNIK